MPYSSEAAARAASEVGFRLPVPWHYWDIPHHERDWQVFPQASSTDRGHGRSACRAEYGGFLCTRERGHEGSHRACVGRRIVAEWHSEGCPLYRTHADARRP